MAYVTFDGAPLRKAEKLVGLSARNYTFAIPPGSLYEQVIRQKQAVFSKDVVPTLISTLPEMVHPVVPGLVRIFGSKQVILAPLALGNDVNGILAVTGIRLNQADLPAVNAFANQIAIALENARLYDELRVQRDLGLALSTISSLEEPAACAWPVIMASPWNLLRVSHILRLVHLKCSL
jgi:GAF domain-containing protein